MSEIDSIEDLCDSVESLPETTSSLERAWKSIPKCMHAPSQPFIIDNYFDPMLQLPHDKVCTMDAVSKCWKTIMPNSDSLLLQETDGITWAICEECVSQIPKEIYSALNFFHKLQAHIQDYAMYAVPMENITLKRDRKRPKIITNIVWTRCERQQEQPSSFLGHQLDLSSILTERMSYGKSVNEVVPAIKIRLAFTGASYTFNNTEEKKTFAVLLVTFARNFDALNYIKEVFLKPSHLNKNVPPADMILAWKRMIRFVAFDNLGLDETRLHKPENYSDDPCGALGVDTLMNLFQIPLQIFGAIYNSHRQSPYEVIAIENLRVSGFPEISFGHNEMTKDYVEYMKAHIDTISKYREQLERALLKYNAPKKKKDEDMEETETDLVFDLVCTGAWPLEESLDIFSKWGMPKMPIFLDFQPEFTPDMQTPFSHWVVEAGGPNGIPELIKTCLRFYMVSVHDNERICWDHFLSNKEFANPSLVLQKYYSEKADPLSALIMPGYLREWWANFTADIRLETDMPTIAEKFHRYLKSVMLNHKSTVECNTYRSERILQAIHIIKKLDFASISYTGPNCIKDMIVETSANMSRNRQHDIYQVTNETFWKSWEKLNLSFKMNCSNLAFLVEMMVSQVFWMMGEHNHTWAAYFQGIQIKSGNGHYKLTTKEGVFDDQRKPNSSGMDWTHGRLTELYQVILDRFGCRDSKDNLQSPLNMLGWTPASIPLLTTATLVEGKVDTLPDPLIAYRSVIATEVRDVSIGPMISNFPRNADGLEQVKLNTCDPNNDNKRKSRVQIKVQPLHIVALSTNVPARSDKENEEYKTLGAVISTMVPGSAPHNKRQRIGSFNNQTCNAFGARQSRPDNVDQIANIFMYSNIWISCMGALINKSAAVPWEINPAVLAYLDWVFFYVKEHVEGILEKFVVQSFRRMKEGYESRQVAKSVWTQAIRDIAFSKSSDEAVLKNLNTLHSHALPASEVPACAHNFLCRGIHMGVTMMVVISGWHLRVPCITPGNLKTFFDKPAVELPEEHQTMNDIRVWLEDCIRKNRLCYDESNHPTMYVTSDGDQQNLPLDDKICMLRVKKCRVADNNICSAIGVRVKDLFGTHLTETCHMGPEASIYGNAMQSMVSEFSPDFRQMFSNFIYASKKHIEKLHLGMPWNLLENWDANEPPPFAKIFHNKTNNMTEVTSYSIGINIWGLLFLVSMGANTLHPHVVYDMSRNILREILNNAPVSCTPGNHCLVRSFSLHTTNVQRIILSSKNRPKHFIRPMNDLSFAATGVFTYAKNIDKYMPEDVMHCGFLFSIAKTFNCDVLKVPGRLVQCEYEILADTFYSVLNPLADKTGCLIADSRSAMVILYVYEDEEEMRWDYTMWSKHLCKSDFIITPMIFRAGALIYHESDTLGLIIPDENDNNFNRVTGNYTYIIGEDKTPYTIKFTDALKQLVPIGQQLYLDLSDPFFASLLEKVPAFQRDRALCLEVRLNVPNIISPPTDQVFVTYLQQHARNRSLLLNQTITVPVWKISERQIGEVITTLSSN